MLTWTDGPTTLTSSTHTHVPPSNWYKQLTKLFLFAPTAATDEKHSTYVPNQSFQTQDGNKTNISKSCQSLIPVTHTPHNVTKPSTREDPDTCTAMLQQPAHTASCTHTPVQPCPSQQHTHLMDGVRGITSSSLLCKTGFTFTQVSVCQAVAECQACSHMVRCRLPVTLLLSRPFPTIHSCVCSKFYTLILVSLS